MEEGKMVWAHVIDVSFFKKKKRKKISSFSSIASSSI